MNILLTEPDIYKNINFKKNYKNCKIFSFKGLKKNDAKKIDAIFIGLKYKVDDLFLSKFPHLKYILSPTTGDDHVVNKKDIKLINLSPKEITEISASAEHTFLLIMMMIKKISYVFNDRLLDREYLRSNQLDKKKILIIGKGRIGKKLGKYCKSFNMKVYYYDKNFSKKQFFKNLSKANIISLNINNNLENKNFMNDFLFKKIKSYPYLINTSRPNIVNSKSLFLALDKKIIRGYAMDFDNFHNCKMRKILKYKKKNLIFTTPHIGGNTEESINIASSVAVNKFFEIIKNEKKTRL
jgi:lactate dehydrogenase-like 2-hydroxyacid dehydrogenase